MNVLYKKKDPIIKFEDLEMGDVFNCSHYDDDVLMVIFDHKVVILKSEKAKAGDMYETMPAAAKFGKQKVKKLDAHLVVNS